MQGHHGALVSVQPPTPPPTPPPLHHTPSLKLAPSKAEWCREVVYVLPDPTIVIRIIFRVYGSKLDKACITGILA